MHGEHVGTGRCTGKKMSTEKRPCPSVFALSNVRTGRSIAKMTIISMICVRHTTFEFTCIVAMGAVLPTPIPTWEARSPAPCCTNNSTREYHEAFQIAGMIDRL
jgi:hypothetical protein